MNYPLHSFVVHLRFIPRDISKCILALSAFLFFNDLAYGQKYALDSGVHHLRIGLNPEWAEFPTLAEGSQLIIHFNAPAPLEQGTISLRQDDIHQAWPVSLNGHALGTLTLDEKDMITYFHLEPGYLKIGDNELSIGSASKSEGSADDVRVGPVILEARSQGEILSEAWVDVEVGDGKTALPARITIVDANGSLQPVGVNPNDLLAVRTGVIYTGNGSAAFGLPAGTYKIFASRGFEYGVDSAMLQLKPGDHVRKRLTLEREVATDGWISCDPHVHTFTNSGHGDATLRERVLTIAGEGLEIPVLTDHNIAFDLGPTAKRMQMNSWFAPITGNEVTTPVGHFNIFPVSSAEPAPTHAVNNWNDLSRSMVSSGGVKVIVLNHARDIHDGFRPFDPKFHIAVAGMNLRGWTFPANAMEIMNSGSQQSDPRQLLFDWFGMLNHGYFLTPVGSSDSHDVSRFVVGQARTYILNKGDTTLRQLIKNFVDGKVMVSFGLLAEIAVNAVYGPGDLVPASDSITVSVKVKGPRWVQANRVVLYANGVKIREAAISKGNSPGVKWEGSWTLPWPRHDLFLVAVAEGPGVFSPFWSVAKPFQHDSPEWNPIVMGSSGAVWVDANGDGRRTSANEYARELWLTSKGDFQILVKKLASFDESIAVQSAALLTEKGIDVSGAGMAKALAHGTASTRIGFQRFIEGLKRTNTVP